MSTTSLESAGTWHTLAVSKSASSSSWEAAECPLSQLTPNLEAVDGCGCLVCHLHEINWWGPRAVGKNHPMRSSPCLPNRTVRPPLITSRPCPVRPRDDGEEAHEISRRLPVENQRARCRPRPSLPSPLRLLVRLSSSTPSIGPPSTLCTSDQLAIPTRRRFQQLLHRLQPGFSTLYE